MCKHISNCQEGRIPLARKSPLQVIEEPNPAWATSKPLLFSDIITNSLTSTEPSHCPLSSLILDYLYTLRRLIQKNISDMICFILSKKTSDMKLLIGFQDWLCEEWSLKGLNDIISIFVFQHLGYFCHKFSFESQRMIYLVALLCLICLSLLSIGFSISQLGYSPRLSNNDIEWFLH